MISIFLDDNLHFSGRCLKFFWSMTYIFFFLIDNLNFLYWAAFSFFFVLFYLKKKLASSPISIFGLKWSHAFPCKSFHCNLWHLQRIKHLFACSTHCTRLMHECAERETRIKTKKKKKINKFITLITLYKRNITSTSFRFDDVRKKYKNNNKMKKGNNWVCNLKTSEICKHPIFSDVKWNIKVYGHFFDILWRVKWKVSIV